jgi:predicted dehydrogenase
MQFALLGNHPDGLEFACALIENGAHDLVCYSTTVPASYQARFGPGPRLVPDLEEILANPQVELVIVAGSPANRPAQLRRALQSERHVACVYPPDDSPDIAHEAGMIQGDTHKVLFPILPGVTHPAVQALAALVSSQSASGSHALLRVYLADEAYDGTATRISFPAWDVLRRLGGEVAELAGFAAIEDATAADTILINGRFESGLLLQATMAKSTHGSTFALESANVSATLSWPDGRNGSAYLSRWEDKGLLHEQAWTSCDPWPGLVAELEQMLTASDAKQTAPQPASRLSWKDVIRGLELDDALRRSIRQRRAATLDYQEGSEEVGFKGTMTLVGCTLLWMLVAALILAKWFPALLWILLPMLVIFLGLQLFRWALPRRGQKDHSEP